MLTPEVVIMGRTRRVFTREFKQEAVKLVTAGGHPTAQVAREQGISTGIIPPLHRARSASKKDSLAAPFLSHPSTLALYALYRVAWLILDCARRTSIF